MESSLFPPAPSPPPSTVSIQPGLTSTLLIPLVSFSFLTIGVCVWWCGHWSKYRRRLPTEVDLLVVGTGAAGLTAALRASECRRVVCVDADSRIGGASRLSGGGIYVPNNHHKRQLGGRETYSQFEAFVESDNQASLTSREKANVKQYFATAQRAMLYLEGRGLKFHLAKVSKNIVDVNVAFCRKHGLDESLAIYKTDYDTRRNPNGIARTFFSSFSLISVIAAAPTLIREHGLQALSPKTFYRAYKNGYLSNGTGRALIMQLFRALPRHVHIYLRKRLVKLVKAPDGTWVVSFEDGTSTVAKDVVLASGGAGANPRAVRKHPNGAYIRSASTSSQNVGLAGVIHPTPRARPALWLKQGRSEPPGWIGHRIESWFLSGDYMFLITEDGNRFVNEFSSYGARARAQLQYDSTTVHMIFDAQTFRRFGAAPGNPIPPHYSSSLVRITSGATMEELCTKLTDSPQVRRNILRTTEEFENESKDPWRERGEASDYNWSYFVSNPPQLLRRTPIPPFYAINLSAGILDTIGVCDTDLRRRVLDQSGLPIPNLYAVGNAGAPLTNRSSYLSGGITLGNAITSGFLCGEELCGKNEERGV